jgi:hypothetical protein
MLKEHEHDEEMVLSRGKEKKSSIYFIQQKKQIMQSFMASNSMISVKTMLTSQLIDNKTTEIAELEAVIEPEGIEIVTTLGNERNNEIKLSKERLNEV